MAGGLGGGKFVVGVEASRSDTEEKPMREKTMNSLDEILEEHEFFALDSKAFCRIDEFSLQDKWKIETWPSMICAQSRFPRLTRHRSLCGRRRGGNSSRHRRADYDHRGDWVLFRDTTN